MTDNLDTSEDVLVNGDVVQWDDTVDAMRFRIDVQKAKRLVRNCDTCRVMLTAFDKAVIVQKGDTLKMLDMLDTDVIVVAYYNGIDLLLHGVAAPDNFEVA